MKPQVKRKFHQYDEDSLKRAVEAIRDGGKLREICRQYGVPKSTVQDRIKGKVSDLSKQMGPDPVLTREIEKKLVTWIENLAKSRFPLKKQVLLDTVQKIVKEEKLKFCFIILDTNNVNLVPTFLILTNKNLYLSIKMCFLFQ